MMEPDSPTEQEQEFISYLRRKRGPCPEHETLIAFQQQTLTPDQTEKIQAHVELCGTCQLAIEMLHRFNSNQPAESVDASEGQRRSRERFLAFLKSQRAPSAEKPWFWEKLRSVFLHPAFAYLLLLALAYPAYKGLFQKPQAVREVIKEEVPVEVLRPALDVTSLPAFNLQSAERAAGRTGTRIRLSPEQPFFALEFFVPVSGRPEFLYTLEVHDSQGRLVATERTVRPRDQLGSFLVVCRRELFSPGQYELRVREVDKATQAVRRKFTFSFTVE